MKIKVKFFSALRDIAGCAERDMEIADESTIADLLEVLFLAQPVLREWDPHLLLAIGIEFATRQDRLAPGDVVSLMPPVQGG